MSGGSSDDVCTDGEYLRLDGAQRDLRDAFFDNESGLFIQNSVPGAGKSTTTEFITAEYLVRASNDGVDAPEERIAFVSFTRDDASSIGPGIEDALMTLARDPSVDLDFSVADAQALGRRVQQANNIGTVDSFLGSVFCTIASEVGFSEVPSVGDNTDLRNIRAKCLERLRGSDRYAAHLRRLERAYPGDGKYLDDAGDLLREAQLACRKRQVSVSEFRRRLQNVVDETYPTGSPETFTDIRLAVERFVNADAATAYEQQVNEQGDTDIVERDAELHDSWKTALYDLCSLLEAYIEVYDEVTREQAVASHVDAAHWVAQFFANDVYDSHFRDRLRRRYTERLSVVVVDEAQDVATVQSAALSPLVDENTRVLLAGDLKQLIFMWRNAQPTLFRTAIDEGRYFDIDWETHVVENEPRTRRCRPDIAAAVDTIFADVFTDSARGAVDTVTQTYTGLEPTRTQTSTPNVHIAAFSSTGSPGRQEYISPDSGHGEADALAECIADGLANDRFVEDPDTDPSVTVVVHRRTNLSEFRRAFERVGLSVGDATENLFSRPIVRLVVEVCTALSGPDVVGTLRSIAREGPESLFSETVLSETKVPNVFEVYPSSLEAIVEQTDGDRPAVAFVHGLHNLTMQSGVLSAGSLSELVETVIAELDLWSDPLDVDEDATRRAAALDALLNHVQQQQTALDNSLAALVSQFEHLYANPKSGPELPLASEQSYDVVLETIFGMKGDESDVIALADIGQHICEMGTHLDTFSAYGETVALAPPETVDAAETPALPDFEHGLYAIDCKPWDYDAGLRWASQRWADADRIAGPPPLSELVHAHRAERWRLLYVALTRGRDHLVIPLPERRREAEPRDYWIDTIRDAFDFGETVPESYRCDTPAGESFSIRVTREAGFDASVTSTSDSLAPAITQGLAGEIATWTPRYVNPSTVFPLLNDPETHLLDYLQGRALRTQHEGISAEIDLVFETAGREDLGDIGHEVIAAAMRNRDTVDTPTLRRCEGLPRRTLERALDRRYLTGQERTRLEEFIEQRVCPQFAESALWKHVQDAAEVYVEEPVDMIQRIGDLDTEIQGTPDVVLRRSSDCWEASEIKIGLQDADAATQSRYKLQARLYAWMLSEQLRNDADVTSRITQLGVKQRSVTLSWDEETVSSLLSGIRALV